MLSRKNITIQDLKNYFMHPIFELVSNCIAKSNSQVLLAESEQWDEFTKLENERHALLQLINLENLSLSESDNEHLHSLMSELIALNNQLEEICSQQRSVAAEELQKVRKGSKVSKAYSQ